jgi:translation initiation factor 4A
MSSLIDSAPAMASSTTSPDGPSSTPYVMQVIDSFDSMGIPDELLRGIYSFGFESPSEIQKRAILPMMERRDIIAQAQSGTGKTGTFVIGSLCCIDPTINSAQVIVLSPTRELAQQSASVAQGIGEYYKIKTLVAVGGNQVRDDCRALSNGAQFIVGTPGRIFDLLRRGDLSPRHIKYIVIDEADQMLEDLFIDQVKTILGFGFPATARIALFSATMPQQVIDITEEFLQDPVRILLPPDQVTLAGIRQYYVEIDTEDNKLSALLDIYSNITISQAIIYVNRRQKAEWLASEMGRAGFTLKCIHGEMSPDERKRCMADFRSGTVRVLISTDLTARGIDVQQVSTVFNYELPRDRENYVHRIGRSGRYGRKGVAINLISPDEMPLMQNIMDTYSTKIEPIPEDLNKLNQVRE